MAMANIFWKLKNVNNSFDKYKCPFIADCDKPTECLSNRPLATDKTELHSLRLSYNNAIQLSVKLNNLIDFFIEKHIGNS